MKSKRNVLKINTALSSAVLWSMVLVLLVAFVTLGAVQYSTQLNNDTEDYKFQARELFDSVSGSFDSILQENIQKLAIVAASQDVKDLFVDPANATARTRVNALLASMTTFTSYTNTVGLIWTRTASKPFQVDGRTLTTAPGILIASPDPKNIGLDLSQREYFKKIIDGKEIWIPTPVVSATTGKPVLVIGMSVKSEGTTIGAVNISLKLDSFTKRFVDPIKIGSGYLVIVDNSQHFLSHPDKSMILNSSLSNDFKSVLSLIVKDGKEEFQWTTKDVPELYLARKWTLENMAPWYFTFIRPEAEITARATASLIPLVLIFLAVLAVAVLLMLVLIYRFILPLEKRLKDKTDSLQSILDNSGQGFFTFGPELVVHDSYSSGCLTMFGGPIGGKDVKSLLYGEQEDQGIFEKGMALVFRKRQAASDIFELQKDLVWKNNRWLEIKFKLTPSKDILVVITDVTIATELRERKKLQDAQQNRVLRALNNRYAFGQFMEELNGVISRLHAFSGQEPENIEAFVRDIHTLKSNAGFFLFSETAAAAHNLESVLQDLAVFGGDISWSEWTDRVRKSSENDLAAILSMLGQGWLSEVGTIPLSVQDYGWLRQYILQKLPDDKHLISKVNDIGYVRIHEIFARIPDYAFNTAQRLGKKIAPITIAEHPLRVDRERMQALVSSCTHIINNMVDHGIEGPTDRLDLGKPEEGSITLSFKANNEKIAIMFSDDGAGIDKQKLLETATKKNLVPEGANLSNSEIYNLIFLDGVSTREKVTETSGRGVGMAAVLSAVQDLGGKIQIFTTRGKGTSFVLIIPRSSVSDWQQNLQEMS